MLNRKFNERAWSGQLIQWIGELIIKDKTIFESATNDEGIKVDNNKTKFPDILLFENKQSGIIFNGWELKFPNTKVDDINMLENALEKAKHIKSNSFVTWNGRDTIIWKINDTNYTLKSLTKIKTYNPIKEIQKRDDMAIISNYNKLEPLLKKRCNEIIFDLEKLYKNNELKPAINISGNFIENIVKASEIIIPELNKIILELKGTNSNFRDEFNRWSVLENSTIQILNTNSREVNAITSEFILAKFIYYKLLAKILFYLTLSENLPKKIPHLFLENNINLQEKLENYFLIVKEIDYQAIFNEDFTDIISFSNTINDTIFNLLESFNNFEFSILPNEVIGTILENLVPPKEKVKFGQYFTSKNLADFVSVPAIKTKNDLIFDPTSGTGTFLSSSYHILKFLGLDNHQNILSQVWGNDISHFPATLSVINLYKEKVDDFSNFPRVIRNDYFQLHPQYKLTFPDPEEDIKNQIQVKIPVFDSIVGNFPFVQQEDILKKELQEKFKNEFGNSQNAFLNDSNFKINERSDYYLYCFYNSLKFLKDGGRISFITSNAWLGKNYGKQFKKFILDNFSVEYIVKSESEQWFRDSNVNTIFITLIKGKEDIKSKFVTINFKFEDFLKDLNANDRFRKIENFYSEIECCEIDKKNWEDDLLFDSVKHKKDKSVKVSLIENIDLINSIEEDKNWDMFFTSKNPFERFSNDLIKPFPSLIQVARGIRTGQDKMFILKKEEAEKLNIENEFLRPILKSSRTLKKINSNDDLNEYIFICDKSLDYLEGNAPNAFQWISRWNRARNKIGTLLSEVLGNQNFPYWYSLNKDEKADIFCSINPDKKLFFSYSENEIYLNQRLIKLKVKIQKDKKIIVALLNSVITLLNLEFNGVSRNLGTLDLNSDFFKNKLQILDFSKLNSQKIKNIEEKFNIIKDRNIESYDLEFDKNDRIEFDKSILEAFGYDSSILGELYSLLKLKIKNRIEMKDR